LGGGLSQSLTQPFCFFKNVIYTKTTSVYTRRQEGLALHTSALEGSVAWP